MPNHPDGKGRSLDPPTKRTPANRNQTWLNRAIQAEVLDLALNISWNDGYVLDQLIVKSQDDGWLVIVKAHLNGHRKVAFCSGESFAEALELTAEFAAKGILTWRKDNWPPKIFQKNRT